MTSHFKALKHQADHKLCPGTKTRLHEREEMIAEDHGGEGSALWQWLSRERT